MCDDSTFIDRELCMLNDLSLKSIQNNWFVFVEHQRRNSTEKIKMYHWTIERIMNEPMIKVK